MNPIRTILALGLVPASVLALAGGLAACGGGGSESDTPQVAVSTDLEPPTATLLDDDGNAMPSDPAAVPAGAGAGFQKVRYAKANQAAWLERSLGDAVLVVDVGCCDAEAVEQGVGIAQGLQAAHDLPNSAPVLVRGADQRLAAATADRLAAAGHTNVWLVTL